MGRPLFYEAVGLSDQQGGNASESHANDRSEMRKKRSTFLRDAAALVGVAGISEKGMNITISIPDDDGLGLKGTVPISVLVQPLSNLRYVRITIDGNLVAEDVAAPYEYQWDTTQAADGTHIIAAVAQYKTRKSQAQVAVTVNNTVVPPPPPPPPGRLLPNRPPHYVSGDPRDIGSYTGLTLAPTPVFSSTTGFTYNLDNTKDYFLPLGLKEWSSGPFPPNSDFRTQIVLNGGRDVVIVSGEARFHSTNWIDDSNTLRVLGGDPNGTIYVEGVKMQACNGPIWSSPRDGVFQNCWIKAEVYQDNHKSYPEGDGVHPDIFSIWTGGVEQAHITMYQVTGYTRYTGLTQLIGNLARWTRDRVDLHFLPPQAGGTQVGNYMNYLWPGTSIGPTLYDGGSNNWMDLGYWGGIREQLQMAIDSPSVHVPAWVVRHAGQDYPGTDPNQYRGSLVSVGATQGDEYRITNPSTVTERWKWGIPTDADGAIGGVFVPEASVGVNYVPPGYQ